MSEIIIASLGDVLINRKEPQSAFNLLAPLFNKADVIIGNYEGVLTNRPKPIPGRRGMTISAVENVQGVIPFNVLSLANNHAMDSGITGLKDTLKALHAAGVQTTGAGMSYKDALRPAYIDCKGVKLAVIGVTGVYRTGTEANTVQGGVAALRSKDYYSSPFSGAVVPGAIPEVLTLINEHDWLHFSETVTQARSQVDFVIAAVHWGDHCREYVITDFERELASRMADAGVDLIIGHHHHTVRGFQWQKKRLTCYGLGNAVFDQPCVSEGERTGETGFLLPENSRFSAVVVTRCLPQQIVSAHLIPLFIEDDTPAPVHRNSDEWHEFLRIQDCCAQQSHLDALVVDNGTWWNDFAMLDIMKTSVR
ncbi:CapA family protein [Photorhabdus tasmaniensis]